MRASQSSLKASEIRIIDEIFDMGSGYVLDFSNKTFSEFFSDELDIDIDLDQYSQEGASKGKRLRFFLRNSEPSLVVKTLTALWEYRETIVGLSDIKELNPIVTQSFQKIIERFGGSLTDAPSPNSNPEDTKNINEEVSIKLQEQLMKVTAMSPQQRGFAYERFLKDVFDSYDLAGRSSFRLTGEQLDGSFQLGEDTYLLEAKWQNQPIGAADLHTFEGKLSQKAAWSRGLFVSNSGFTTEGLHAFGRGKKLICIDGFDISEMLRRKIPFTDVVTAKARAAAETGSSFISVRELFL